MELFKHIECFFVGKDRDLTETILKACDIETRYGIMNLVDRCLLSTEEYNKCLMMHSLIQDMGRDLVRQESLTKPWKRSRLWRHEESFKVLKQEKGTEDILGLALDMRMLDKKKSRGSFEVKTESLSKMDNLMLLQLNYVQMNGPYEDFPEELRWLCMHGSPLKSIPLDLPMENLVALDMSYSNLESFGMSKELGSLQILDLSFSEHLHSVGGFSELLALERLIVRECISLIEVCESVEQCVELVHIDMSFRESEIGTTPKDLKLIAFSLPSSLRILSLANNNLSNESFPGDLSCLSVLKELYLDGNPIVSMPDCVRSLPRLETLSINYCEMVISIEGPPHTLRELSIDIDFTKESLLRRIKFDPKMSPLILIGAYNLLQPCSLEIDGLVKMEAMACVEDKVLHSLG
ncbi:disease resistance protein RPP2A-like [Bidens hawaiensis]|uniref:disease resistance protein RPP2A-like n=1 Tax=Bidens hawaiensis TaxID=980011 RepID=UPI00404B4441